VTSTRFEVLKLNSCSRMRRIMMEVAMMAGWAFSVAVRVELGPLAMMELRGLDRMWSISCRKGLHVLGKASSQGVVMPTRWTPWPVGVRIGLMVRGVEGGLTREEEGCFGM